MFDTLKWANYISPRGNPPHGERPRVYIVELINRNIRANGSEYDVGLAVGTIILVALEESLGACCIGPIDSAKLMLILDVLSGLWNCFSSGFGLSK